MVADLDVGKVLGDRHPPVHNVRMGVRATPTSSLGSWLRVGSGPARPEARLDSLAGARSCAKSRQSNARAEGSREDSPRQYVIPVSSCAQWVWGYGSRPLFLMSLRPQEIGGVRLSR